MVCLKYLYNMFLVFECHKIKEEKFSLHFQKILIINLVTFGSHRGLKIHIFYKTLKQYYISHNGTSYFWRIKDGYFLFENVTMVVTKILIQKSTLKFK